MSKGAREHQGENTFFEWSQKKMERKHNQKQDKNDE